MVVSASCAIWVVDAVSRILTSVTAIGIGDAVGVIRVGIQVATKLPLAIEQLWAVAAVAIRVVKCVCRLWRCLGQIGVGAQVAQIGLGSCVGDKRYGHDSQGDQMFFHDWPAGYCSSVQRASVRSSSMRGSLGEPAGGYDSAKSDAKMNTSGEHFVGAGQWSQT